MMGGGGGGGGGQGAWGEFKELYATTTLINFLLFSVEWGPMGAMNKDTVGFELTLGKMWFWKLQQQN